MTVFTDTWNSAYEGLPADNEGINQGAARMRSLKVAVHQRLAVDHSWSGDAEDGKHVQSTYRVAALDPAADPGEPTDGFVYTKAVGGNTELFYKDSAGNVLQLTSAGTVHVSPFPSGTAMVFAQTSPPVGWVQTTTVNDHLIRIVGDGSGTGVGGSWTISGLSGSTSVNTSITNVSMNVTINPVTLSTANVPAHTHGVTISPLNGATQFAFGGGGFAYRSDVGGSASFTTDNGSGSTSPFTPTGSASFVSGSASSGATTTVTADGTWRPLYYNMILAVKS